MKVVMDKKNREEKKLSRCSYGAEENETETLPGIPVSVIGNVRVKVPIAPEPDRLRDVALQLGTAPTIMLVSDTMIG